MQHYPTTSFHILKRWLAARCSRLAAGFTLIEMIVSVAIFMFVMLVAVGSLVALVGANRKAQSISAIVDNLRFALDDVSRTVRTGYEYNCSNGAGVSGTNDCTTGGSQIAVIPQFRTLDSSGNPIKFVFRFSTASQCGPGFTAGCLMRSTKDGAEFLPITSPEIEINPTQSKFFVRGSTPGTADGKQPEVVMTLSAVAQVNVNASSVFNVQTTITQRRYDN